ncbi:MAG: MBOAT family protein [Fluviicola sp.]|nr:MBOAT family protein [Fluviicola sp.]
MLFSSLAFLFYFLPLLLGVYYISPKKYRNTILLIFSLVFYAWGGVSYSLILIASILFNFLFAKQIEKNNSRKKTWLAMGLTVNVLVIVSFKYIDFFISNISWIKSLFVKNSEEIELLQIVLPLGISFFTFQQMSMLWDLYRNENRKKTSLKSTALYISFFPQLIAGPIVRYNDIIDQISSRKETLLQFRYGIQRFIIGLGKKIILANACGEIADNIMDLNIDFIDTPTAWLGIIAYTLQIYFDFSGYSDMAIGLGKMFGFTILENFNLPYISKNITEFWRRWHISLSTWFKDYVYIPLGGNRNGSNRMYRNLLIVFLLTGFWHGATWSFVLWGLYHGIFLIIEKVGFLKVLRKIPQLIQWFYAIIIVMIGWVFFRIEELPDAISFIGRMFGVGESANVNSSVLAYLNNERVLILGIAILVSTSLFQKVKEQQFYKSVKPNTVFQILSDSSLIFIFFISIVYINSGSYNPFIYFRF